MAYNARVQLLIIFRFPKKKRWGGVVLFVQLPVPVNVFGLVEVHGYLLKLSATIREF